MLLTLTFALGCSGNGDSGTPDPDALTWHRDIAPIVQEHCVVCHSEDGMQPGVLFDDPEVASILSGTMDHQVQAGKMPPFYARETEQCENPWGFDPDPRLSAEELALFSAWADAGGPIGDPATATPLVDPPSNDLTDADLTALPAGQYTTGVAGDVEDEFICFSIDPGQTQERWLQAYQIVPQDLSVVHHVLVGIDETGATASLADENGVYDCFGGFGVDATFIGGWIPGASPVEFPEHSAYRLPAEARVLLQMHYHLVDEPRADGTGVALRFSDETPVQEAIVTLLGNSGSQQSSGDGLQPGPADDGDPRFFIPAGASDHSETMRYHPWDAVPREMHTFLVANHMHYIGSEMRLWIEHEQDSTESCVLHTPEWDFDWQQFYFYDPAENAPTASPGDALWLECVYDNSLNNPGLVNALHEAGLTEPADVTLGEGSLDEMCIAVVGMVFDIPVRVDHETHPAVLELQVSSTDHGFGATPCEGPASLALDGDSLTGVAACGLDMGGALFTVELALSGTAESGALDIGVLWLDDTATASWTGSVEDGISIEASGSFGGGVVEFSGVIRVP
jgi:hypothetical protein